MLNGNAAAALLDTGAGLSFLSNSFAVKNKFAVNQLDADEKLLLAPQKEGQKPAGLQSRDQ
jgi:hypothetical protein